MIRKLSIFSVLLWPITYLQAQQHPIANTFSLHVSGGAALLSGEITDKGNLPYGYAQTGFFLAASGNQPIGRHWGITAKVNFQRHGYDAMQAARDMLYQEALAEALTMRATTYNFLTFSAGPYFQTTIGKRWQVNVSAQGGMVTLYSPYIEMKLKTQPHNKVIYQKGNAVAGYFYAGINPVYHYTPRIGIGLNAGIGYAAPLLHTTGAEENTYSLKTINSLAGISVCYRFSYGAGKD